METFDFTENPRTTTQYVTILNNSYFPVSDMTLEDFCGLSQPETLTEADAYRLTPRGDYLS